MFRIYAVAVENGQAALCPMPGLYGAYVDDLAAILAWQPDLVISMTKASELASGFHADLGAIPVRHVPVVDFGVPMGDAGWSRAQAEALDLLAQGRRVLVHCKGGCGRSGMAVLRLMIRCGETPQAALTRLRSVRPCAVETDAQFVWAAQLAD